MTPETHDKLQRASYANYRENADIVRESLNRYLAELESDYQKKTGKGFPPIPAP